MRPTSPAVTGRRQARGLVSRRFVGCDGLGADHHPIGAGVQERMDDVPLRKLAVDRDSDGLGITARLGGHGVQLLAALFHLSGGHPVGQPAVGVGDDPAQYVLGHAAQDDWRVGLLGRLGIGPDQREVEVPAGILGFFLGPEPFHGFYGFACLGPCVV